MRSFACVLSVIVVSTGVWMSSASAAVIVSPATVNLDFDTDALGSQILHGQVIDSEYAAWGIDIDVKHPRLSHLDFGVALNTRVSIEADSRTSALYGAYHPTNTTYLGNVLITPRNNTDRNTDGIMDKPDTAYERPNGTFTFTLDRAWLSGAVTILDAEEANGTIKTYRGSMLLDTVVIPALGDNSVVRLFFGGQQSFNKIVVQLAGSGGLDALTLNAVPEPAGAAVLVLGSAMLGLRRHRA
jgi:hypothetical protein